MKTNLIVLGTLSILGIGGAVFLGIENASLRSDAVILEKKIPWLEERSQALESENKALSSDKMALRGQVSELNLKQQKLEGDNEALQSDNMGLQKLASELEAKKVALTKKLTQILEKAFNYLSTEGKATIPERNISCAQETEQCLDYWTKRLMGVEGPECGAVQDGLCPQWCAAGADYDCCGEKQGYQWYQGRGCYPAG